MVNKTLYTFKYSHVQLIKCILKNKMLLFQKFKSFANFVKCNLNMKIIYKITTFRKGIKQKGLKFNYSFKMNFPNIPF